MYDPSSDGTGEYRALIEYKERLQKQKDTDEQDDYEERNVEKQPTEEPLFEATPASTDETEEDDDSDDEFDYLLDDDLPGQDEGIMALEEQRRAEMEEQLFCREISQHHGYGCHRQMHPGRVLKAAGLVQLKKQPSANSAASSSSTNRLRPPAVVLHLVDPDSMASASLDVYFEERLAKEYPGTVFLRSGGRSTLLMDAPLAEQSFGTSSSSRLSSFPKIRADQPEDFPALVAIRDGIVVNTCPGLRGLVAMSPMSDQDEDGDENMLIVESAVHQWLDRCNVLLTRAPPIDYLCNIRPEEEALMDYLAKAVKVEDQAERYDCGMEGCSKTYPHEHVGIKTSQQDGLVVTEREVLGADDVAEGVTTS